jgi:hypothetical protein
MDYTPWLLIAAVPVVLVGQIYLLGRKMSAPEKMIHPIMGGLTPHQEQTISQYKDWLDSVNLRFLTNFQFGSILVAVYHQENKPRFFSFLFHQKLTFQIESYLEDLTILDTGTSGNGGLFPRPGAYAQSLPNLSPQEAWQRHLEGEAHLSKKFGYVWIPLKKSYEQILPEAMRLRMKYNRSQLFWPLRVLYRYFVTRHQIKNKTIVQQFP